MHIDETINAYERKQLMPPLGVERLIHSIRQIIATDSVVIEARMQIS